MNDAEVHRSFELSNALSLSLSLSISNSIPFLISLLAQLLCSTVSKLRMGEFVSSVLPL